MRNNEKLYRVIVAKTGSLETYADSPEDAMKIANETFETDIFWSDDFIATDAEEIEKES